MRPKVARGPDLVKPETGLRGAGRVCYNKGETDTSMPVTRVEFRAALRLFAAGVTVVTTRDEADNPTGLTASAFTSVSLDPPLILVCVDRAATAHPAVLRHGWFAINVLARGQEALSRQFAVSGADKFAGVGHRAGLAGLPLLDGALATLQCRLVQHHDGGDHSIFVGQVEQVAARDGAPLVYFQGDYRELREVG
jgi:flavin reductase (DIM6/NTAB) family NADH-FMN oxidoreductase RutF